MLSLLFIAAGILALIAAGRLVSRSLVVIAKLAGVSEFAIAFFLLAFSTTIPEFFVGINAALEGVPTLSLGDVFGSNIVNLTLIAGLVVLLGRQKVVLTGEVTRQHGMSIVAVGSLPVFLLIDGSLSRIDGIVLLCAFTAYLIRLAREKGLVVHAASKGSLANAGTRHGLLQLLSSRTDERKKILIALGSFAVGILLLLGGAKLVVESAEMLIWQIGVSPFFVGVFLLAFGTSLPELSFGIRAALARQPEISIGDVLGAVALNSSWILGVVSLIHPIVPTVFSAAIFSGIFMIAVFIAFFFLLNRRGGLYPREGVVLLLLYILFVAMQLRLTGIRIPV